MTYIITGHYGSGKTEFVVNLAIHLAMLQSKERGSNLLPLSFDTNNITIADLDVINPFFRSRELAATLASFNIDVDGSCIENHVAQDIPAISFSFLSKIRRGQIVILDLAGNKNGINLLANCYESIKEYEMYCVFNPFRPETNTAAKMIDVINQLSTMSNIPITGIVNNTNLLGMTSASHVLDAQKELLEVSQQCKLPIRYALLHNKVYSQVSSEIIADTILTFEKPFLRKEWQM